MGVYLFSLLSATKLHFFLGVFFHFIIGADIAKRFVTGGLEAALGRKEQANRHKKIDGRVEAHIIAIACSEAPEGRERWTLQLIADELVRLGVVDSISDTAVMETLKKRT